MFIHSDIGPLRRTRCSTGWHDVSPDGRMDSVWYRASMYLRVIRAGAVWAAASLLPNLLWEVAQLPLYTLWYTDSTGQVAYAIIHCTLGDGLISAAGFIMAAGMLRDSNWPEALPRLGALFTTALALAYTVFSEYRNVYVARNWAYSELMPTVFGLGLSPLLQWVVAPTLTLVLYRRLACGHKR